MALPGDPPVVEVLQALDLQSAPPIKAIVPGQATEYAQELFLAGRAESPIFDVADDAGKPVDCDDHRAP